MRTKPQLVLLAVVLGALAPAACSGNSSSTYGVGGQSGASGAPGGGIAAGGTLSGGSGGENRGGLAGASAGGGNDASGGIGGSGNAGAPTGGASGSAGAAGASGSAGTSGSAGSSGASGNAGSSGASGNAGSSGASGSAGVGGASGSAGFGGASGTGGSSGSGGSCSTKVTITRPLLTDFESYDGSTPPANWVFLLGDGYGGVFPYDDGTGVPSFAMFAGASSNWAIGAGNTLASAWGGGLGVWASCFDASYYEGLSFMVRGLAPRGVVQVALQMDDVTPVESGGTCTAGAACFQPVAQVPVSADWSLVQIPWSAFAPGVGSAGAAVPANGDEISSISFGIGLNFVETDAGEDEPVPSPYQLAIDDIGFF